MGKNSQEIEKYLTQGEVVEATFDLSNATVFATNKRLFVKQKKRIQDIDYNHISSVSYSYARRKKLIIFGILLILLALFLIKINAQPNYFVLLFISGVVCIILGIVLKKEWLEVVVTGFNASIKFEDSRQELDRLLKIIREKKY